FQYFCAIEFGPVHVDRDTKFWRHLRVEGRVEQQDAGVDEIRLAFEEAGPHGRYEAVGPEEEQSRAGKRNRLAIQEINAASGKSVVQQTAVGERRIAEESAAGDLLIRNDAIEAVCVAIIELLVARCIE